MATNNIEIASQMSKMIAQQNKMYAAQGKMLKAQLEITKALIASISAMPVKEVSDNFNLATKAVEEADAAVNELAGSTKNLGEVARKASDPFSKMNGYLNNFIKKSQSIDALAEGINMGTKSFKLMASAIGSVIDVATTLIGTIWDIGLAVASAPFKWLGNLIESAGAGGSNEFAEAINNVRKQFGQLATNEAKGVMDAFRSIRGDLAQTGISAYRILGNYANRLKEVTAAAMELGSSWNYVMNTFTKDSGAEQLMAYKKGLGLTEEGMKGVGDRAQATGKSFNELGREITSYAYQLGDAFGVNGKIVSRAVGDMMKDVKNFGSLSVKQMSQIAVYTKKLGIEFKELLGIVDKFDNFEDAAEGAAQLSQAFGMNLDALEMMKEQDPAKRFEMLRSEFAKTGKDINALTRQERALLAAQTGLADETLVKAFSNQAMSYDEIMKSGDKLENKQLSEAEAMQKLAMSIERMVQSGGGMKGFFDAFLQGLERGIRMSGPFREMFRAIQRAMQATRLAGMELGRDIVKFWPGLQEVFGGVRDFFKQIGSFTQFGKPVGFIKTLSATLGDFLKNPSMGLEGFMKKMKERLGPMFDKDRDPMKKIIEGAKNAGKHLMKVFAEGLKFGFSAITDFLKGGTGFLKGLRTGKWDETFGKAKEGFSGFIYEVFEPIINVFKDEKLMGELKNAFLDFAGEVWEGIKDVFNKHVWPKMTKFVEDNWTTIAMIGAGVFLAPAIVTALGAAIVKGLSIAIVGAFKLAGGIISSLSNKGIPGVGNVSETLGKVADATMQGPKLEKGLRGTDWKSVGTSAIKFGLAMAAVGLAALALVEFIKIWPKELTMEKVMAPLATIAVAAYTMSKVAIALDRLAGVSRFGPGTKDLIISIGVMSIAVLAMAGTFKILQYGLADVKMSEVVTTGAVIGMMALAYASAIGVIIASGVIGLAVGFTFGIGAAAIAGGFAVLALTVTAMVTHAITIIDLINSANVGSGFKEKAAAVGLVVGFYIDVAKHMLPFIQESNSGIGGVIDRIRGIWGKKPETKLHDQLGSISGFIHTLMKDVIDMVKGIEYGDMDPAKMNALAPLLQTLGSMFTALLPSVESLKDTDKLQTTLITVQSHIREVTKIFSQSLLPSISDLLSGPAMSAMSTIKIEDIEKLTKVFDMLVTLFKVMTPSPELINSFKEYQDQGTDEDGGFYKKSAINIEAMKTGLSVMGDAFKSLVDGGLKEGGWISSISSFITKIGNAFGNSNSKSLNKSMDIFLKGFGAMKEMHEMFSSKSIVMNVNEATVNTFFDKMDSKVISAMVTGFDNLDKRLQEVDVKALATQVSRIDKIKDSLVKFVSSINEQDSVLNNLAMSTEPINLKLGKVADKIGIKDKSEFLIQRGELNIMVNMNVTFDTDDVVNIIKEKKVFQEK